MRILLIHNKYKQFGGEDTTFLTEKALLEGRGHEVETLIFDNAEIPGTAPGALSLAWRSIYNPASAAALKRKVLAFRPDVAHVHNFFYQASPAIFIQARRMGLPIVATLQNYRLICAGAYLMRDGQICEKCVHGTFPFAGVRYACHSGSHLKSAQLIFNTGLHKTLGTFQRCVSRFITVTEFNRGRMLDSSLQPRPDQIVVKPNSVEDAGFVMPNQRTGAYLFVGRLSPEKGIGTLLDAAAFGGFPLEIVGGGPLEGMVREYALRHPNIQYLGFQSRPAVLDRMREAKALLFPSVWYEGLPLTILEAMSTGLPVIISDLGNLNEIVTHKVSGLCFKPGDAGALAGALKTYEAEQMLDELSAGARQTYLERYTPERNYRSLMEIYTALIGEKARMEGSPEPVSVGL